MPAGGDRLFVVSLELITIQKHLRSLRNSDYLSVTEEGPSWCYVAELSLPFTLPFVSRVSQVRVPRADTDSSLTVKHACFVLFLNADVVYIVVISFST